MTDPAGAFRTQHAANGFFTALHDREHEAALRLLAAGEAATEPRPESAPSADRLLAAHTIFRALGGR